MANKAKNKTLTKELILVKNNKSKIKLAYIAIILLGSIFIAISCFHNTLWFDESYSVAIANHSLGEIWTIGSNDVHPVLYYWILKIVKIITNNNLIMCRLFSCVPLIIMAILGYTHIRKDFGEKVGLIFTFLSLFMPTCVIYSGEMRMYTCAMLFVTIMSIYAYRIYRSGISTKNWIIFSIFSLCSAYTHYYGLIVAFIENIALFLYFGINTFKQRNNEVKYIKYTKNFKRSIFSAIIQIVLYLPWIGALLGQVKSVSKGFWIGAPNFLEIIEFQFTGNLGETVHLAKFISWPFTICGIIYLMYSFVKNWKNAKPAKLALMIYTLVFVLIGILSIFQPIMYARYFLNLAGLFFFIIAFFVAKNNDKIIIVICTIIVVLSTIININLMQTNYDKSNIEPYSYMLKDLQPDDIIITDNNGSGFVMIAELNFSSDKVYFWDRAHWNVEEAYKAYGKTVYDLDSLKDYKGRIWIVSSGNFNLTDDVKNTLGTDSVIIKEENYYTIKYQHYEFAIALLEKN